MIFTPKYCVSCGKKIPIRFNLFSVRYAFNIIICKNCDFLIDPYYENDDESLGVECDIDGYLIESCREKISELRECIGNKINEEIGKMREYGSGIHLDYFFKDHRFVVILTLYNIMKDFIMEGFPN